MNEAKTAKFPDTDLLGDPVTPIRDRRGRPSFKKTVENQEFVAVRSACGWSHRLIAEALGCKEDTLRKHFSGELAYGRILVEGQMLDVLMRKMKEGHVPAIQKLRDFIEGSAPTAPRRANPASPDGEQKAPAPVLGKKEQRLQEAQKIPEDWGDIDESRRQ